MGHLYHSYVTKKQQGTGGAPLLLSYKTRIKYTYIYHNPKLLEL